MRSQENVVEFTALEGVEAEGALVAALLEVPGVQEVRINRFEGRALVTGDPGVAAPEALREAVGRAGFQPGDVWFAE